MIVMPEITLAADGDALVSGDLLFSTVTALLPQGDACFSGRQTLVFDLAAVGHSDSSAIALLLELLDRGRAAGVDVSFRNIPTSLMGIAHLSNVEPLLA